MLCDAGRQDFLERSRCGERVAATRRPAGRLARRPRGLAVHFWRELQLSADSTAHETGCARVVRPSFRICRCRTLLQAARFAYRALPFEAMRTLLWTAGCLAAIVCAVSASPQLVSHSQRRLSQQSETTSTDSSTQGGPLTSFVTSINGFFEVSSSVNVNNVPSEDTVSETGDYSAFAFPASSFNTSVIVNVSTGALCPFSLRCANCGLTLVVPETPLGSPSTDRGLAREARGAFLAARPGSPTARAR